jgi:hypothetical protein
LKLAVNIDCPAEVELHDILFYVFSYHTVPDLVDAVDVLDGISDAITLVALTELEADLYFTHERLPLEFLGQKHSMHANRNCSCWLQLSS